MAILPENAAQEAIASRATSLVVTIDDSKHKTPDLWEPVQLGTAILRRWWHTKAYGTVFIIGLLTLLSLMFLQIHWTYRKLLLIFTHQGVGGHKCYTLSRKSLD